MKKPTINYTTAWLMGIDLIATGKQLKAKRRSYSLTQEELSERFEQGGDSASRAIISMWENGKKLPSLSHVVFLAELYSCSLDELVISHRRSRAADDGDQPVPFIFHMVCQGRTHGYAFVLLYVTLGLYVTIGLYSNASTDGIIKSQNPKRNIGQQTEI